MEGQIFQNQRSVELDGKIIRREEAARYFAAKSMVEEAKAERARILEAARLEAEQQKLFGYGMGLQDGRREQARVLAEAILRREAFFAHAEQEVCSVVVAAVRKIFADFDDIERTRIIVHQALGAMRSQTQATIRVHPNQYESLKKDVSHITALFPNLQMLSIEPDGTVPESTCILSSELGTVEASIDTQIEALEVALAQAISTRENLTGQASPSELAFIDGLSDEIADAILTDMKAAPESWDAMVEPS